MRILFVTEGFPPVRSGGAEISTLEMAREIGKKHEVVVFAPSYDHMYGLEDRGNFRTYWYKNSFVPSGSIVQQKLLFSLEMTKHLAAFARKFHPDIVHAQNLLSAPSVAKIARTHRIVGVAHIRDHRFECFTSRVGCLSHRDATLPDFARCIGNPIYAMLFPYAKFITRMIRQGLVGCGRGLAVSNYIKSELLQNVRMDVRVSYPGMDLERIRRRDTEQASMVPVQDTQDGIFYGGGLTRVKGIFELLAGFKQASKRLANAFLLVAGDGPDRKDVAEFIRAGNLGGKVRVLGGIPHETAISVMKRSRLVVVPSLLPEAASRIAIEGLACGKPVLASNRGAVPEIVGDAGVTFSPSPKNIEHAIFSVLNDRERLQKLSSLAEARASMFSISRTCRQVTEYYEEWLRS